MSHFVLQTSHVVPLKSKPPPIPLLCPCPRQHLAFPVPGQLLLRRSGKTHSLLIVRCSSSSSPVIDGSEGSMAALERCFRAPEGSGSGSGVEFAPVMKKNLGSMAPATLKKGKLVLTERKPKEFTPEIFDRKFVDAVLSEWHKTMAHLPAGLRQAYEMGLVSSAQMVRYLAMNARPTTARLISRALPDAMSRGFIGRMIADPAFLYKLLLESAATLSFSVWWNVKNPKDRKKQKWGLALVNGLIVTLCNAIVVYSIAPCRSYGNTSRFHLLNMLQKLPNNIFEKSYPLREFNLPKRLFSVLPTTLMLFFVGAVQGSLTNFLDSKRQDGVSVTIPSVSTYAVRYGAFLGLNANLRYQLLCLFDGLLFNHFDAIGVALLFSTALRLLNVGLGELSRAALLGVKTDPLVGSDNLLKAAYNRNSQDAAASSSKLFISEKPLVSGLGLGLGLLGIRQGNGETPAPKARRKRIVRKKVSASSV
ncbi:hypothetical protein Tsubulata_033624 [Turnera subulata]|uniref:Uncharacterized protein n=1 Tax=Turnera subulata TaxID=218843 RepID=A0A9Q0F369_9ROSI|nr:hypothetical protein Tsubulata_033624 [Turnera subulata]